MAARTEKDKLSFKETRSAKHEWREQVRLQTSNQEFALLLVNHD